MLATYGSFLVILSASCLVGQGVFALCGRRQWSWLAPAVGLSVLTAVAWGTVRLPGEGTASLIAIGALTLASLAFLIGRVGDFSDTVRVGLPVAGLALLAASLPFLFERRFGILGTGLNPDMSQHLYAADQLAHGRGGRLLSQGYPLGPHSLVVAVSKGTGASLVHCFDGLMLAISVGAALVPLALVAALAEWRRVVCALLVGLPYMVASYLIQGAFKETMEALFVLAFAIGLHELARGRLTAGTNSRAGARYALAAMPLAALGVGAIYSYSFPGLLWLAGAAGLWAVVELGLAAGRGSAADAMALARRAAPATAVALTAVAVAAAPEIGRMIDFASFETFNPSGAGLGNLFNRISPLEALGIWPSGDFRLDPGDGAAPAIVYYLGDVLGLAALAYGLTWWLYRGERAVPSALAVAAALIAYAHFGGTPYQEAKSVMLASPLAMLIAARALLGGESAIQLGGLRGAVARRRSDALGAWARHHSLIVAGLAMGFCGAAAGSSLVALVNGPVGPATYSPDLAKLRPRLGTGSTLVLAPEHMLADEHGRDYLVWELRGGRVCVEVAGPRSTGPPPQGVSQVIAQGPSTTAPFAKLRLARRAGPYTLWRRSPGPRGQGPCPLISVGKRADLGENGGEPGLPGNNGSSGPHAGSVEQSGPHPPRHGWL
jgi:hypothetical protein